MTIEYNNYARCQYSESTVFMFWTVWFFPVRSVVKSVGGISTHIFLEKVKIQRWGNHLGNVKVLRPGFHLLVASASEVGIFRPRTLRKQSFQVIPSTRIQFTPLESAHKTAKLRQNCSFVGLYRQNYFIFVIEIFKPWFLNSASKLKPDVGIRIRNVETRSISCTWPRMTYWKKTSNRPT